MAPPIFHPNTQRILCDIGPAIDVSISGAIPPVNIGVPQPFIYDGDAAFAFAYGNDFAVLRVKLDGSFCWYSNLKNPQSFSWQNANIIYVRFIASNVIQTYSISDYARITTVQLPTYFANAQWIVVQGYNFPIPPCPCNAGQPYDSIYYDPYNDRILVTYTKDYAEAYDLWAGVYQSGTYGTTVLNEGYCGNFPQGTDPIQHNSDLADIYGGVSYGLVNGQFSYDQSGYFTGRNIEFRDLYGNFVVFCSNDILVGGLNCAGTGEPLPSYNVAIKKCLDQGAPEFAGMNFRINYQSIYAGANNLQNVASISNIYGAHELFDGRYFIELAGTTSFYSFPSIFLKENGGRVVTPVQSFNQNSAPPYNFQVYIATPRTPIGPLGPTPSVNMFGSQVLNWHRPISIGGFYKT